MPSVTLKEIADRVGVSMITASRVLNGKAEYARPKYAERADRIRRVAAEMGYRPNSAARAMSRGRFGAISLMLAPDAGALWLPAGLIRGLTRAASQRDLRLLISEIPDEKLGDSELAPQVLRELSVDGLVLDYLHQMPEALADVLRECGLPLVFLNDRRDDDCVYFDDRAAVEGQVRDLVAKGHRRIAYFGPPAPDDTHYSRRDRLAGYLVAMAEQGLSPIEWIVPYADMPQRRGWLTEALTSPEPPTAVICYGSTYDSYVVGAALRHGIRIPDRLSIVTFSHAQRIIGDQPIDTLVLPQREIAQAVIDAIEVKIRQPEQSLPPCAVPFGRVSPGGSVAPHAPASVSP